MSRSKRHQKAEERIQALRERIAALDHVCSGTITKRRMKCGKPTCRCARDPEARHGPYYEWGHVVKGQLVHRWLSPEEAKRISAAIRNHRELRRLLRAWEKASLTLLEDPDRRKR